MLELEITARQLAGQLASAPPQVVLLDVREPWEVATATIGSSQNIPIGQIVSRAARELDPAAHIVVYCHSGIRSMDAAIWLRSQGFDQAQSLRGGIDAWSREVDSTVPRY